MVHRIARLLLLSAALCVSISLTASVARTAPAAGPTSTPIDASPASAHPPTLHNDSTVPVLSHPATQENPAIDGRRVVWQDARSGPADIFLADLDSGEITNLTQSGAWEALPDISGNHVIWKDPYQGIGIHGIDLATGQTFTVTERHTDIMTPHISGGVVVWADFRAGAEDPNIYGYDIAAAREFVISDAPGWQQDPRIDWPYVVWWDEAEIIYLHDLRTQQTRPLTYTSGRRLPDVSAMDNLVVWQNIQGGNWDIYGYDLATQSEFPLVTAPGHQEQAVVANGLVAFQSQRDIISWDIYLHVLDQAKTFAVTDSSLPQTNPAVSGSTVVWQDTRGHQWDIYRFEWTGSIPPRVTYPLTAPAGLQVGAFPDRTVRLQWTDTVTNETNFVIERAQGMTSTAYAEIAVLPANSVSYTDTPDRGGETYWYRLRARNGDGYSDYSNEAFTSTFTQVPSLDEQYLMVLVNEARAAPAAFGYPDYAPVPPLAYHPLLAYSARSHSQSILNADFQFGHCDLIGRCPSERAAAVGYTGGCSENLVEAGQGPLAMQRANQAFLDSTGHRENMLAGDLVEFGMGHTYDARWSHGQVTEVLCGRPGVVPPVIAWGVATVEQTAAEPEVVYHVNFYSAEGDAPTQAQAIVNGHPHTLSLSTGRPFHGTYRLQLPFTMTGAHTYFFRFEYGPGHVVRWPAQEEMYGPIRNRTLYVDGAVVTSGDGSSAERAFKTIGEALAQARPGDTLSVAAGTYHENITLGEEVTLLGAGWQRTKLQGVQGQPVVIMRAGSRLEGVWVLGAAGGGEGIVATTDGELTLRHNRISQATVGISISCASPPCNAGSSTRIRGNIVDHNTETGILSQGIALSLTYNTIVDNRLGIQVDAVGSRIEYNIIAHHRAGGLALGSGVTTRDNLLWANDDAPGQHPGNLYQDPLFVDVQQGDYRLYAGSPAVGRGARTGEDWGALPFAPVGMPPSDLKIVSAEGGEPQLTWRGSAAGYQLYIGAASGYFNERRVLGATQQLDLDFLDGPTAYTLALSSLDAEGRESRLSSDLLYSPPSYLLHLPVVYR